MGKWLPAFLLCVTAVLPSVTCAQQMDRVARQQIETAVARLSDPLAIGTLQQEAAAVMASVGLQWNAPVVQQTAVRKFSPDKGAVIELVDIRLLLTQIAIQTGARDHLALVRAQGARDHDVILLRGGFATLQDLLALAQGTLAQDFVTETADGIVLTRPLAIWADAGLTLGKQDRLTLDRASGSFVANLGWLNLTGGSITGSDTSNATEPGFRPFVLTAGQGSFTAKAATFQALGFGAAPVFGGLAVVNNGLVAPDYASAVTESLLLDVMTLALIGTTGADLSQNRIAASSGTAVLISQAKASVIANNTLTGMAGPQAIRVTARTADVQISGNLLAGAARTGIAIDGDSRAVSIAGNLVAGSVTTGISVDAATCVTLAGNLVAANGGVGISLTDTTETAAIHNAILFNHGSGVLLRDQAKTAQVSLTSNVFIGNRDGVRGATPGPVELSGNDLNGQVPRVFAGDLARLTAAWLRDRRDAVAIAVHPSSTAPCAIQGNG